MVMKQSTVVATAITGTIFIFLILCIGFMFLLGSFGSMSMNLESSGGMKAMQDSAQMKSLYADLIIILIQTVLQLICLAQKELM